MKKMMLWKRISAAAAAAGCLCGAAASVMPGNAFAADAPDILILGDSISAGYGLADGEKGYYEYLAASLHGNVTNLAVSGDTTQNLIDVIDNAANKDTIAGAELICISIGGNDLLKPAQALLADQQQEGEALIDTVKRVAAEGDTVQLITDLTTALREPRTTAKANYAVIEEKLRALNPNAVIVMQTVYNPFEVPESILTEKGLTEDQISKYRQLMNYVSNNEKQLNNAIAALETVKTADVFAAFEGSGWIYDRVLEKDIHPTALGHALIAALTLDAAGLPAEKCAEFRKVLEGVSAEIYATIPADDLALLQKYAAEKPNVVKGDVDSDTEVTLTDAQLALTAYVESSIGNSTNLSTEQFAAADVDEDGGLSLNDAQYILIYYVQALSDLPAAWEDIIRK